MNSNDPTHLGEPGLMPGDRECDIDAEQPIGWVCIKCKRECRRVSDKHWWSIKSSHCCDSIALPYYDEDCAHDHEVEEE